MDAVAQGATWTQGTKTIRDANGAPITDAVLADFTIALYDAANADQSSGITIAHVAGGKYRVSKAMSGSAALGEWIGTLTYDDGSLSTWVQDIAFTVVTAAQADPASVLTGGSAAYGGPVAQNNDVELYRTDDYAESDSRELPWTLTDAAALPDLTDAAVTLYATHLSNKSAVFSAAGAVDTPTGSTRVFHVDIPGDATATMPDGEYDYSVQAALDGSGNRVTLVAGTLTLKAGGRPPRRS